ncbi:putative serine protease PepD [Tessaracoccus bendigoensis DSM 12906]|uniref:Putative serine protease PepD n=1 Tax=Tessaracoccus bendigoensis DSM 12906 TaxID=1123357 RepID=A0A1M6M7S5_9ACTN|nr:trypsin-like peptidase domain-containing protein [Tessaracoccus bendigoensis]SHJ79303.1 putative serine protease PepD [Tessaracoccus bendigoensis DSM 12906]
MSNEQYPNPWSRESGTPRPWPQSDQASQPVTDQATGQASTSAQAFGQPSTQAQGQTPTSAQDTTLPQGSYPFTNWNTTSTPYGAAQQPTQTTTAVAPQAPKKAKGRSRIAAGLAMLVLAGGVGGGAGFAAARLSTDGAAQSPSASSSTTTSDTGGIQTTVVQADPTNPDWTAVAEVASKSVVAIDVVTASGEGQGSGVVIDGDGNIVTNNHVVSGAANGTVTVMFNNSSYEATIVGTDPSTDLAVIRLTDPPEDLGVMGYGDSKALKVGDPVMAIGNPLGLADTVTTGIVSALNRPVTTTAVSEQQQQPGFGQMGQQTSSETVVTAAIQTNAAINPGNSGGALVDSSGKLIGITSSIATLSSGESQSGNIGIGFAIGADQVKYVADQLIATGSARHAQLGISARDVTTTGQLGAVVAQVNTGSPAAEAGLRVDDLITEVDGQPVSGSLSLVALVRAGQVGQPMTLTVLRDGSEESITVTPVAASA